MGGAGATGDADTASALGDAVLAQPPAAATSAKRATLVKTRQVMEAEMIHRHSAGGETGLERCMSRVIVATDVHGS
jgi:hypothetical protein